MARTPEDDLGGQTGTSSVQQQIHISIDGREIVGLPSADFVKNSEILRDGQDLVLEGPDGTIIVIEGYFNADPAPLLQAPDGQSLTPQLVESFVHHTGPVQYAQTGSLADESPVGAINEVSGKATVTRTNGTTETITVGTPIFEGDIVETEGEGAVNIVFIDETSLSVSSDAKLAIDEYVFDPGSQSGTTDVSVLRGLFVFTSGLIGRDDPDDVNIDTPMGSIGIRGTVIVGNANTGEVTVMEGAIVLRGFNGSEITLAQQFETGKFVPASGDVSFMGKSEPGAFSQNYNSLKSVSPNLFSGIEDNSQKTDDSGTNDAATTQDGEAAATGGESTDTTTQTTSTGDTTTSTTTGVTETETTTDPARAESQTLNTDTSFDGGSDATFDSATTTTQTSTTSGTTTTTTTTTSATSSTTSGTGTGSTGTTTTTQPAPVTTTTIAPVTTVSAVSDTDVAANTVSETTTNGTAVGVTAFASDPTAGDTVSYSLVNDAGGRFAIHATTGVITVADNTLLNAEAATSHSITVRATSTDGSTQDQAFSIGITDDNSEFTIAGISDADAATDIVSESAANGTSIGITAYAADGDISDGTTYSLDNDAGGRFAIDAGTGVVTVADNTLLDYESFTTHNITIRATSDDGSFTTQTYTVSLSDDTGEFSVSAVSDTDGSANSIAEGIVNGTVVGITASASDSDASDSVSYSLTNDAGGRFAINATTGVITVLDGTLLDYETNTSHSITVRATSTDGSMQDQSYSITVTDVDEFDVSTVTDIDASANAISETAANGTAVGITASASDADGSNNGITYSLTNDAGGRFAINSATGVVTVADTTLIDYESATSHSITIQAMSADGSSATETYMVTISDDTAENSISAVTDANVTANSIAENVTNGSAVGITANANDADASDSVTYSLDDNAGGRFAINSTTGVVTVADASLIDFESATTHAITIRATSSDATFTTDTFTIAVTDIDDDDVITGTAAADPALNGGVGNDIINGNGGNDTIIANNADGSDTIDGGADIDTYDASGVTDNLTFNIGTGTSDTVTDGTYTDTVQNVEIYIGGSGSDIFNIVDVTAINDMHGGTGTNDTLDYSALDNTHNLALDFGTGDWTVNAGSVGNVSGFETVIGSQGDDTFTAADADGNMTIDGGAGNDIYDGSGNTLLNVSLAGGVLTANTGTDTDTLTNIENFTGTANADNFTVDTLSGLNFSGGGGLDEYRVNLTAAATFALNGAGTATVTDGTNSDTLTGVEKLFGSATHNDRFVVTNVNANQTVDGGTGGTDELDFSALGSGVTIDFSASTAAIGGGGTLSFSNFESLSGTSGVDILDFSGAGASVNVDLDLALSQIIDDGSANSYTANGFEDIRGSAFADIIDGDGSANMIWAGAGNDDIAGGAGNDTLYGEDGDDTLHGGAGDDLIDGGTTGETLGDTVDYADATGSITVDLSNAGAQAIGGGHGTDTLASIENIIGSAHGDDLKGNALNNKLEGGAGDDTLRASAGNDTLDGGAGIDTADYSSFTTSNAINVSLNGAGASVSSASGTDTLVGIENIIGTQGGDTIDASTDASKNEVMGGAGADILTGGANDVLRGGAGNDTLTYNGTNTGSFDFAGGMGADIFNITSSGPFDMIGDGINKYIHGGDGAGETDTVRFNFAGNIKLALNGTEDAISGVEVLDFRNSMTNAVDIILRNFMIENNDGNLLTIMVDNTDTIALDFGFLSNSWTPGASGTNFVEYGDGTHTVRIESVSTAPNITVVNLSAGAPAPLDLGTITGAQGTKIWDTQSERFGFDATAMGDLNGDGYDDILLVKGSDDNGHILGLNGAATSTSSSLASSTIVSHGPINYDTALDMHLEAAGDFTGDGIHDFILAAPSSNGGTGSINLISGSNFVSILTLTGLDATGAAGSSIAGIGDINHDGFEDIIVSAPNAQGAASSQGGEIYVVYGGNSGAIDVNTLQANGDGFVIEGDADFEFLGKDVSGAGDINGDGYSDFMFSAPTAGIVDIALGGNQLADGIHAGETISITGLLIDASNQVPMFNAGDMNGDGLTDIMLVETGGARGGNIRIFGGDYLSTIGAGGSTIVTNAQMTINAATGQYLLGAGAIGDWNGDGYDDIAIAVGNDGSNTIDIYVYHGADTLAGTIDTSFFDQSNSFHTTYDVTNTTALSSSNWAASAFDVTLNSAGDVNGDGLQDLFIGMADEDGDPAVSSDGSGTVTDDTDGIAFILNGKPAGGVIIDEMGPDLTGSLWNHWKLDETAGTTAADDLANNDGVMNGFNASTASVAGVAGTALLFDGANDYIDTGSTIPVSGAYSVSIWASVNNTASQQVLLSQNSSSGELFFGLSAGGNLEFGYNGQFASSGTGGYNDGTFHNFTFTYDGTSMLKIYMDGVEVGSNGGMSAFSGATGNLLLGTDAGLTSWFNGEMDDVKLFTTALTAAEVQALNDGNYDADSFANNIAANANNQSLVGTALADDMWDNGMNDIAFSGGAGGDIFHLSSGNFRNIDGGSGLDFLDTGGSLDLSTFAREEITRIEGIKLNDFGTVQTLVLTLENIFNLMETSDNGTFKIDAFGDTGDILNIDIAGTPVNSATTTSVNAEVFGGSATVTNDGTYNVYDIGGHTLLIDNQINVNLV